MKYDGYNFIGLLHHEQRDYMWVQRACIQTLMFYETLSIFKFMKYFLYHVIFFC